MSEKKLSLEIESRAAATRPLLASTDKVKFGYSEKATKFEKNLPLKIWRYWVASNLKKKIFSNFVAFSEYPNFNLFPLITAVFRFVNRWCFRHFMPKCNNFNLFSSKRIKYLSILFLIYEGKIVNSLFFTTISDFFIGFNSYFFLFIQRSKP